ncbi:MAG: NADH-quinone oxidoreductase subunit A [Elusimicrobia bacterium]|nr:NADH-quinone oxidoreductase subunit A [Elusimicrobiota bacterium]
MTHWNALAIVVDLVMVLGLTGFFANANRLLGPHPVHEGDADIPFETGERPIDSAEQKMSVLYHRFAVLFVVFDVDLAFLMPWALSRGSLTAGLAVSMTVFTALLFFMLAYFWRKGVLECR